MPERDRISQFDGVRALAFTAVFLHHGLHVPLLWMGVDQFFVLSGFLITRNLLQLRDETPGGRSLMASYYRRLLGIPPPSYLALAAILLVPSSGLNAFLWFFAFPPNTPAPVLPPVEGPLTPICSIAGEGHF